MTMDNNVVITHAPDRSRYELAVDGVPVGIAEYRLTAKHIVFVHTTMDAAYEGQGLATQLIRFALDDARAQGLAVVPRCSFVADFVRRHPDYLDLVHER